MRLPLTKPQRPQQSIPQGHRYPHQFHRHHASLGPGPTTSRTFHIPHLQPPALRQQTPSRPQLREEDECPVCFEALPPKGPNGSESARESHVAECVEARFSASVSRASRPPPSAAIATAIPATSNTSEQASERPGTLATNPYRGYTNTQYVPRSSSSFQQRRRTAGMITYNATEKDCVGENGEGEAECVICFEEFCVGDEMGRLECLCKYHNRCIRQWWQTKGPGACPVHQDET